MEKMSFPPMKHKHLIIFLFNWLIKHEYTIHPPIKPPQKGVGQRGILLFQNKIPHLTSLPCQAQRPPFSEDVFPWQCGACACVYDELTHPCPAQQTLLLAKRCVCLHKLQMVQPHARLPLFLWCCKHEKVNSSTFMRISIIPTSILSLNREKRFLHKLD